MSTANTPRKPAARRAPIASVLLACLIASVAGVSLATLAPPPAGHAPASPAPVEDRDGSDLRLFAAQSDTLSETGSAGIWRRADAERIAVRHLADQAANAPAVGAAHSGLAGTIAVRLAGETTAWAQSITVAATDRIAR